MIRLLYLWWLVLSLPTLAQTYTGVLTTTSPSFDSPEPNGSNAPTSYAQGTYYYQLFSIPVTTAGPYTFQASTTFLYGGEGILYQDPGPVADVGQTTGASVINSLVAVGSNRSDFTLTKTLAVGQYYFAVSTYAEKMTGSFTLTITGPTPLPVRLSGFTAQPQVTGVQLVWTTASELHNAFFVVERSADGQQWDTLAQISGQGSSMQSNHYSWIDAAPLNGLAYYRLRQTDTDSEVSYSPVVSVTSKATAINFFPNPVLDYVVLSSPIAATFMIYDMLGHLCRTIRLASGTQQVSLNNLPTGIYWIKEEQSRRSIRLMKL
jgi:hypothetical protein